jgi:hypothetical protein
MNMFCDLVCKNGIVGWVHIFNPRFSAGGDWVNYGSKPEQGKSE